MNKLIELSFYEFLDYYKNSIFEENSDLVKTIKILVGSIKFDGRFIFFDASTMNQ